MNSNKTSIDDVKTSILSSFRKQEERALENIVRYAPKTEKRYLAVPFLHDSTPYCAIYDVHEKRFTSIEFTIYAPDIANVSFVRMYPIFNMPIMTESNIDNWHHIVVEL